MAKIQKVDYDAVFAKYQTTESSDDDSLYCKTGLIPFDLMTLGRGFPRRRLIHVWSPNGLGKSTSLYSLAKAFIKKGEGVVWVGVEPTQKLAEDMGLRKGGVDIPLFKYVDLAFYEDLQPVTDAFLSSPYKWMIIDSITAVSPSPKKIREDGIEAATIGVDARIQSVYFRLYHALLKQTDKSIIYVTQSRMKIATKWGEQSGEDSAGGMASKFYSDLRFTIVGNANVMATDMGSGTGKTVAGKKGWFVAEKIRHASPQVRIPVTILYGKGLSNIQAIRQYLTWKGAIKKAASFFQIDFLGKEESVQGKAGLYDWIRANQAAVMEDFYANVEAYFQCLQETKGSPGEDSDE